MSTNKVWFITGASKGLGVELTKKLLESGHQVIATSRNADNFKSIDNPNLLPLNMELVDEESIAQAIKTAIDHFGKIDVVVNNAGYGLLGTVEELSNTEIQDIFKVNVFGLIQVSKAILPHFRARKTGQIINIASVSGSVVAPATGIYSATKAAVIQISEALHVELAEFGIKVTAVCPGGFRTDFLDKSSMVLPKNPLAEYTVVRNIISQFGQLNKNQGGDPKKAADAFIALSEMENPPARIYFGSDALRMMERKISEVQSSINQFSDLSQSTNF
jgi:short-subunit dehydrogenase